MKSIVVLFIITGISFYIFLGVIDQELWRGVIAGIGFVGFIILSAVHFFKSKENSAIK